MGTIKVRTLFGRIPVPCPRYRLCKCELSGVDAPIVSALPERITPELPAPENKWASLMTYGGTVKPSGDIWRVETMESDAPRLHRFGSLLESFRVAAYAQDDDIEGTVSSRKARG